MCGHIKGFHYIDYCHDPGPAIGNIQLKSKYVGTKIGSLLDMSQHMLLRDLFLSASEQSLCGSNAHSRC